MSHLLLQGLLAVLPLMAAGFILGRELEAGRVTLTWVRGVGLGILAWGMLWLGFAFGWLPAVDLAIPIRHWISLRTHQIIEYRLALLLLTAAATLAAWSLFSHARSWIHIRSLKETSLDPDLLADMDPNWEGLALLRQRMEAKLQRQAGIPSLRLLVSDRIRAPLTTGWRRPSLFAPLWMFQTASGDALRLLLEREVVRLRSRQGLQDGLLETLATLFPFLKGLSRGFRLAAAAQGDLQLLDRLEPEGQACFLGALREVTAGGPPQGLEVPLGPDPALVAARIRLALQAPSRSRLLPTLLLTGIALCSLTTSAALGPSSVESLSFHQVDALGPGFSFADPTGQSRCLRLPGSAGTLPTGVLVDTRMATQGHTVLQADFWQAHPLPIQSAYVRVRMEVTTLASREGLRAVIATAGSSEQSQDEGGVLLRDQVLIDAPQPLPAKGATTLEWVLPTPGAGAGGRRMTWGPHLYIPAGYQVKVTAFHATPASAGEFQAFEQKASAACPFPWTRDLRWLPALHLNWDREW